MNRPIPATKQKLEKARKKGDVARSFELTSALVLLLAPVLAATIGYLINITEIFVQKSFAVYTDFSTNNMLLSCVVASVIALIYSIFINLCILVPGLVSEFFQVGLVVSWENVKPDFSRLNVGKGLKRILGLSEDEKQSTGFPLRLYEIGKMAFFVTTGMYWALLGACCCGLAALLQAPTDLFQLNSTMILLVVCFWILSSATILGVGIVDYALQHKLRNLRLRMDLEEFRKEIRESEGDVQVKASRRQLHKELLLHGIIQNIRKAKVLISGKARI